MHSCRATVTSLLFGLGATLVEVMAFVGHADAGTTIERYGRPAGDFYVDPLVLKVKAMNLPLAEAWNRLYELTWATYGTDAASVSDSVDVVDNPTDV